MSCVLKLVAFLSSKELESKLEASKLREEQLIAEVEAVGSVFFLQLWTLLHHKEVSITSNHLTLLKNITFSPYSSFTRQDGQLVVRVSRLPVVAAMAAASRIFHR